jgi:hypothetical protein
MPEKIGAIESLSQKKKILENVIVFENSNNGSKS